MLKTLLINLFLTAFFTAPVFAAGTTDNTFTIGKGASNKQLIFNKGNGATNPRMRWNDSTSKIEFTHDGVVYNTLAAQNTSQSISASNIDWAQGNLFTKTLAANTTFTFSNQVSGQVVVVRVTNTVANYTVTWPVGVLWSGGTAPTQTVGAKSDVYTFVYDGTTTYGSAVQDF